MCGEDDEDLRDGFKGLPLESRIGVEVVRVTVGRVRGGVDSADGAGEESGEERGKGMLAVVEILVGLGCFVRKGGASSSVVVDIDKRKELLGLRRRAGGMLSSTSSSRS